MKVIAELLMKIAQRSRRRNSGRFVVTGIILIVLTLLSKQKDLAYAQIGGGQWGEPLNLSRSGATDKPHIVVDSRGVVHLLWQDTIEGYYYSSGDGESWSQPALVDLPFGISRDNEGLSTSNRPLLFEPVIAADNRNRLHAFWRDASNTLFYSSVSASAVAELSDWSEAQGLAESALDVDSNIDSRGRIHVAFVRALDSADYPSGIYYLRSIDGGESWTLPQLLYETPYFRSLSAESANVKMVTTEPDRVMVAWDDRPQERVYVVRSADGGDRWEEPTEIDRRLSSDGANAVGPSKVSVAGHNNLILVIWIAGHNGQQCSQYYQYSDDGGSTWKPPEQIIGLEGICADESQLVDTEGDRFLLSVEATSGTLISSWTDQGWSQPFIQQALTAFENPETFRPVELGCKKFETVSVSGAEPYTRLMVVGCDRGAGEDVWFISADLSTIVDSESESQARVWRREEEIASGSQIGSMWLAQDSARSLYAIWNQKGSDGVTVFQSVLSTESWSPPQAILQVTTDSQGAEPQLFFGKDDVLTAVWTDGNPGALLIRQAYASPTLNELDWSSPDEIPVIRSASSSPYLIQGIDGKFWMAYSIPLNEDRGIYLTESDNGGLNWASSRQVFDGIDAGWQMVEHPVLLAGDDDTLHLIWAQYSSPPDAKIQSLVYSQSSDGGSNWLEPAMLSNGPAGWVEMAITRDGLVHRFWAEANGIIWHDSSADEGITWSDRTQLTSATDVLEVATVARDELSGPQLLAVVTNRNLPNPAPRLLHWGWNGNEWERGGTLSSDLNTVLGISGLVNFEGDLETMLAGTVPTLDEGQTLLVSTGRQLDRVDIVEGVQTAVTPDAIEIVAPTKVVEPIASPTALIPGDLGSVSNLPGPAASGGIFSGPILGITLSAAIVGVVLIVSIRFLQKRRW